MKCLETPHREARPVGYGMIGWPGCLIVSEGEQSPAPRITPFPTGRIMSAHFPGISCLATLISSLRDNRLGSRGFCRSLGPQPSSAHVAIIPESAFTAHNQSPITNHQSPITNHQSPITNHQSPITNHQSPFTSTPCRLTCSLVQRFDPADSDNQ
jgi:hypothetical protein